MNVIYDSKIFTLTILLYVNSKNEVTIMALSIKLNKVQYFYRGTQK